MSQLFKKVACFTDIHFGNKANSRTFNSDCEDFVKWFIEQAKANNCETCIFLGDWHHHRSGVNVSTLNYTVSNIGFLSEAFENVYMIMGNHDLFYREKREIHSLPFADQWDNVHIINDKTFVKDDVAIIPWLVEDEWKGMKKIQARYVFGHFELPYFKMNAMVEMPDHGGLKASDLQGPDYVFSGHFHKRQNKDNIWYLGSPFPHNYADAWDDERGMMILEWGGKPEFIDWPDMPRYRTIKLSTLLENPTRYLNNKTYARVTLDIDITYEEATFIKEEFAKTYGLREISLMPQLKEEHATEWAQSGEVVFESVDQIVISQIQNIESEVIDKRMLVNIYNQLSA